MNSSIPRVSVCASSDTLDALRRVAGFEFTTLPSKQLEAHPDDVVILDPQAFESRSQFFAAYRALNGIALIIAHTVEDEVEYLTWLKPDDDLCLADRLAAQIETRIARLRERATAQGSRFDPLTRLLNRKAFQEHIERAVETQPDGVRLILIDLDHFKLINDTHGHVFGDAVLVEFADMLRFGAAPLQAACRVGGDEFALLAEGSAAQVMELAESIRKAIETKTFQGGLKLTASLGVSEPIRRADLRRMWEEADRCVYAAKSQNRNRVVSSDLQLQRAGENSNELDLLEFEDLLRVVTDRVTNLIRSRGRRMFQKYQNQADHDALTALYNRGYLDKRLEREFQNAIKNNWALSIALIDLDHFGEVNRSYDYPTGDAALRVVAAVLQENIRSVDWIARYGGEEFCLVMPGTRLEEATDVAERLCQAVRHRPVEASHGRTLWITASLGVVERSPADATTTDLLQRVSNKVRQAKTTGRDKVCH